MPFTWETFCHFVNALLSQLLNFAQRVEIDSLTEKLVEVKVVFTEEVYGLSLVLVIGQFQLT
jgi:hypothetical protein